MGWVAPSSQSLRSLTRASHLLKPATTSRFHCTNAARPRPYRERTRPQVDVVRWQHNKSVPPTFEGDHNHARSNAPHKEYFQNPEQSPNPDLSPYARNTTFESAPFTPPPPSYLQQHPSAAQQNGQQSAHKTYFQDTTASLPQFDSFLKRLSRSSSYILVFLSLGAVAGTGLITWEYLSPMFEEGSEEEAEMLAEILDTMDDSELIFGLREDGWKEVDLSSPNMITTGDGGRSSMSDLSSGLAAGEQDTAHLNSGHAKGGKEIEGRSEGVGMGRSMLYQILTGTKGLVGMRMFHHPSQDYSVMVFFAGFGVEGWPDVVHGGLITTLLEEAVQKHLDWYHHGQIEKVIDIGVHIDFKKPVQPGEIYAVLVPPALVEPIIDHSNLGFTHGSTRSGLSRMKMVGLFMQLEGAPKVSSGLSAQPGGTAVEHQIQVPGRSQQGPDIHAVAEITLKVVAGRGSGTQQQELLDSITKGNALFGGNYGTKSGSDEE